MGQKVLKHNNRCIRSECIDCVGLFAVQGIPHNQCIQSGCTHCCVFTLFVPLSLHGNGQSRLGGSMVQWSECQAVILETWVKIPSAALPWSLGMWDFKDNNMPILGESNMSSLLCTE